MKDSTIVNIIYAVIIIVVIWLAILTRYPIVKIQAQQPEKNDAEFIRVNKAVEVRAYDHLGRLSNTWTETIPVLMHRYTKACWVGNYGTDGRAYIVAAAPPGVCK